MPTSSARAVACIGSIVDEVERRHPGRFTTTWQPRKIGLGPAAVLNPTVRDGLTVEIVLAAEDVYWIFLPHSWLIESSDFVPDEEAKNWVIGFVDRIARYGAVRRGAFRLRWRDIVIPRDHTERARLLRPSWLVAESWEPW